MAEKEEKIEKKEVQPTKPKIPDNVVLIGAKPPMAYVLGAITQLANHKEIYLKARGRAISRAVDVAEIVKNKFNENIKIKDIEIGTEEREAERGKINVSTISICLSK